MQTFDCIMRNIDQQRRKLSLLQVHPETGGVPTGDDERLRPEDEGDDEDDMRWVREIIMEEVIQAEIYTYLQLSNLI